MPWALNDAADDLVPHNEAIGRLVLEPSLPLLRHLSLEHDIDLAAAASELAGASLSASTRRVYAGALARLDAALDGAPLEDVYLAAYIAMLFATGKSPATLAQVVAAVRLRAKLAGAPSPTGPATDRMLAGARRKGRRRGRGQVTGVRWEQADAVAAVAARDGGRGDGARGDGSRNDISLTALRDAAIIAVMSDAMLRVSELAALECTDVDADPEDGSGRLTIRRSKTDQEGAGAVQYLGPATLERVRVWTRAAGGERRGALSTRSPRRAGRRRTGLEPASGSHHRQAPRGRSGRRGAGERTQPAGRRRPIARGCGRLGGRDAGRGALGLTLDAGALRAG